MTVAADQWLWAAAYAQAGRASVVTGEPVYEPPITANDAGWHRVRLAPGTPVYKLPITANAVDYYWNRRPS